MGRLAARNHFPKFCSMAFERCQEKSIHFLTRDVLKFLEENGRKVTVSDQTLSVAMSKLVVLEKEKCDGLHEDITWRKAQIKRRHGNLRGYRIDFEG